jgi:two-component system, LytTR family, sensor histidine kinase AlgZ
MTNPSTKLISYSANSHSLLPHLCSGPAVFGLVIAGELVALALVLWDSTLLSFPWAQLGYVSMVVQWIMLLSALVLCRLSKIFAGLSAVAGGCLAYLTVLLIALCVLAAAQWIVEGSILPLFLLKNMLLTAIFSGIFLRYLYLQQQLRNQQQAELHSRIQALHARIRPHFLFNSMNAVASLIPVNPVLAEKVVEDLSEVFRMSLQQASLIPLASELELCRRYVDIETVRLGERLIVEWQGVSDVDISAIVVPSFILQPLIENAIYHGIQRLPDGGVVTIALSIDKQQLRLIVQNPLPVFEDNRTDNLRPDDDSHGNTKTNQMALANITHRLQAHYGDKAAVETKIVINEKSVEVYQVTLFIPIHNDVMSD